MVWHQALGAKTAADVARYHVEPNHLSSQGLPSISYTMFIEPAGTVLLCNDLELTTWSQGDRTKPGDENRLYLAVCFGGNFDGTGYVGTEDPTAEQLAAGSMLWWSVRDVFGWDNRCLYGHYHFGKPACPGVRLQQTIENIRASDSTQQPSYSTIESRQEALQRLGYYRGEIDGQWGPQSTAALVAFQEARGLVGDGLWGPQTTRAMNLER